MLPRRLGSAALAHLPSGFLHMDNPVLEQMRAIYPHHGEAEEGGQPGVHKRATKQSWHKLVPLQGRGIDYLKRYLKTPIFKARL